MTKEQGFFKAPDQTDIYYQCWLPKTEAKAALILVHGVAEHSGRYMNLVNRMVPEGFSVYGLDHYGHGKSGGKRLFVPDFKVFTQCLDNFVDLVAQWERGKPLFIVGHSMGGLIASSFLLNSQDKVKGAVLSGPGVKIPDHVSQATIIAAKLFSLVWPGLGIKQLEAKDISRDPAVVEAYINDPLVSTGKLTARLAAGMLEACQEVMAQAQAITRPLLILHGGADVLVEPDASKTLHQAVASQDNTLTVYPDKFHEIFNDPGYEDVFSDMLSWLEKRT